MNYVVLQDVIFIITLICLSIPLGIYIYKVMTGQKVFLTRLISPIEKSIYKLMGVDANNEMSAKRYAESVFVFSSLCFIAVFSIQLLQGVLPYHRIYFVVYCSLCKFC